jgi:hypothetical protein
MIGRVRMRFAIFVVAGALLLPCTVISATGGCSPETLDQCRDANRLIWSKTFAGRLRHFLGRRRANYLSEGKHLVSDQVIAVLGGVPDAPQRIGDLWRFTACRAHSCSEKGAAVLKPDGEFVAVAILHSPCGEPDRRIDCASHWTLSIFCHPSDTSSAVIGNLSEWARAAVHGDDNAQGLPANRLDGVDVVKL